jgi:endonuclease G
VTKLYLFVLILLLFSGCGSESNSSTTKTPHNAHHAQHTSTIKKITLARFINANNCNQVIDKEFYTICYDFNLKAPTTIGYTLSSDLVNELNIDKHLYFTVESSIEKRYRAAYDDYTHTGYDRGHLASDASFDYSQESLESVYSLANIIPQARKVNRYTWTKAERLERFIAVQLGQVNVLNVIRYSDNPKRIGKNQIAVPVGYYKILFNHDQNYTKCLYYENDNNITTSEDNLKDHVVECI